MTGRTATRSVLLPALLCIVLLAGAGQHDTARANGLPVQQLSSGSSMFWPTRGVPVAILHEDLTIEFFDLPPVGPARVSFAVNYRIAVVDQSAPLEVPLAFIADGHGPIDVRLDGEPISVDGDTAVRLDHLDLNRRTFDPLTGEQYEMAAFDRSPVGASVFTLTLAPDRVHELTMTHTGVTGWDQARYLDQTYHYTYYLSPAGWWADFGQLDLTIIVPDGFQVVTSLDEHLDRVRPGVFTGSITGLPPNELHISLMRRPIWPGVATRTGAVSLWLVSLAAYALMRQVPFRLAAGAWLIIVTSWLFTRELWLYPLRLLQTPVMVLVIGIVLAIELRRWRVRIREQQPAESRPNSQSGEGIPR